MEIAVLALGCFWGPEIKFSKIEGIIKTEVGYCGGDSSTTTYKEVCTGKTCLLYTSPSPRDLSTSRMPSSA